MAKKKDRIISDVSAIDCVAALRASFASPEFAFFEQVANGVGWGAGRWADAVAMGIWPSRGLLIHGFEIKVERRDWLRELKNPAKAEEIHGYCDRWWVCAPKGLIDKEELPPTWGLYEVREGRKGTIVVTAPELTPKPLTRAFVAAILRRQADAMSDIIRRERHEAREEGALNGAGELAGRLERNTERTTRLTERIEEFEKKSGVDIDSWNYGNVAEAVRALTSYRTSAIEALRNEEEVYARRLEGLREDIRMLEKQPLMNPEPGRREDERDDGEDHRDVAVG